MCQGKGPETEVRGGVRDAVEAEFYVPISDVLHSVRSEWGLPMV